MYQHLAALQPGPAFDDQPANAPLAVVEKEIGDGADPAVARLNRETLEGGDDLQHG
jgi:hypothetical protein